MTLSRNPEGSVLIWGLKISELVGVVGFVIAIVTGIFTLLQWLQGSEVRFSGPRLVGIECDDVAKTENGRYRCTSDATFVVRASTLTYTNTASGQYNAIIINEKVIAKLAAGNDVLELLELNFQYFSDQTRYSNTETTAKPFMVKAASSVANETVFFPWKRQCGGLDKANLGCDQKQDFLVWTKFIELFSGVNNDRKLSKIYFKFVSTEQGGGLFGADEEHFAYCFIDVAGDREDYQQEGMDIYQRTFVCREAARQIFDEILTK